MAETVPYHPGMYLGRIFDLEKFQPGLDIFTDDALSTSKIIERHQTTIRYSVINNSSDINNVLDVGGHISLKVKAGLLKVEGMGSYLKEDRSNDNTLEILARAHVETMTETMTDSNPKPGWNKNVVGSHYIRSITYGGDLIVRIQIKVSDSKQLKDIKAKVGAGLDLKIGVFDAGAQANFRKMEEDLKASSQIEISYYSTSLQGTMPRDIEGMLKTLDTFKDQVMKINEGKGVPLTCELLPLNILDAQMPQVVKDKSLDVQLGKLENYYDDVVQAQARLGRFLQREDIDFDDEKEKISEIEERLDEVISVFNSIIATLDLTSGGKGSSQIEEAFSIYKKYKKIGGYQREVSKLVQSFPPEQQEIATSETPVRDLPPGEQLDLLLIGKTGNGKSATGNTILREDLFESDMQPTSVTRQCQIEHRTVGGRKMCVVDSPGMMDTEQPEAIFLEVGSAITRRPDGYHAFLIVLNIDVRMTEEELKAIHLLKKIFGKDTLMQYAILVFTHGDSFYSRQKKHKTQGSFQDYIKTVGGELGELLKECNQRCILINNMEEDPGTLRDQVVELIKIVDSMKDYNDGFLGKKYTNHLFRNAQEELKIRQLKGACVSQRNFDVATIIAFTIAISLGYEKAHTYIEWWAETKQKLKQKFKF